MGFVVVSTLASSGSKMKASSSGGGSACAAVTEFNADGVPAGAEPLAPNVNIPGSVMVVVAQCPNASQTVTLNDVVSCPGREQVLVSSYKRVGSPPFARYHSVS